MTATILVVDDKEQNRNLLTDKLLKEYYLVVTASNGQEALKLLKNTKIDLVLLDAMMPGMSGYETCLKIKTHPRSTHIPVIIVTALSSTEERVKGFKAGADEFITKPIDNTPLFARIKALCRVKATIDYSRLKNHISIEVNNKLLEIEGNFQEDKILIIDDNLAQAKSIKSYIQNVSPQIYYLPHPNKLAEFKDFIPDLIIISCQIPGIEALRICANFRVKHNLRHTCLMLLLNKNDNAFITRAIEIGVHDYFIFPSDREELQARVRTQLRKKNYYENLRNNLENSVDLSTKDGLTNVFNRRYFDIHIEQMLNKAQKFGSTLSLLLLDMDHFKLINDNHGHQAGDNVLKSLAIILKSSIRTTDLIARYGGEEFAILLSEANKKQAMQVAELVRKQVANFDFKVLTDGKFLKKTVSIGVAEYQSGEDVRSLIERSDQALYQAKAAGRNRVIAAK